MKRKRDNLEDAIRMLVRLQIRFAKEGVGLHFTMTTGPVPPPDPKKLKYAD